jgi:electron transfer flavoprotein alpha subunit
MIALIPVRDAVLPSGADETIAECGGRALVVGSAVGDIDFTDIASEVFALELGPFEPARWAALLPAAIGALPGTDIVVLPNSSDGRDLAPRLAAMLDRPLFAGATLVTEQLVRVVRRGGMELHEFKPVGEFVATLQPGVRGAEHAHHTTTVTHLTAAPPPEVADATVVEVLPPDVRTMDLTEAARIVGGGAGLDTDARFRQLDELAGRIGAVMGATRVITDRHWVHHDRQIGTTGVVVDPQLYISFGVSGAVQHTSGLGSPDHIISVNTDPHCPMMAMSDLAIVADANATIDELLKILERDDR